ncbi:MAG: FAD-binding protein, partial [Prevotella sp.]|nr:FAD-binding protein [Prevotella sp.]
MKDIQNYSLKEHNTFGIDAKCRRFIEFEDDDEAVEVAKILRESATPYIIIGGGSNLLLTKDFDGIVVRSGIKGHYFEESGDGSQETVVRMTCGSGEVWDDMVATSIKAGYYGMENLSLIPGDVGASAVQNIGAYGLEAKDLI